MWGQGHACVFPEGAEHTAWVPSQFVKLYGLPDPKDEESETGRLTLGQGATEADSSINHRVAKEMADGETDMGQ
jgi:hypothetical protein